MNPTLKKKIITIITAIFSFVVVVTVAVTCSLYLQKVYYSYVFVSGGSMNPTLIGGHDSGARGPSYNSATKEYTPGDTVHFGITDESNKAKDNIKRFDIVTTYYPEDYDDEGKVKSTADYKIKRVIALPYETFKIEQGLLMVKKDDSYVTIERTFTINEGSDPSIKDVSERTLGKGEYWVMGDNRKTSGSSKDCVSFNAPVTYKQIIGVLVCVEGTAEFFYHYYCKNNKHEIDDIAYLKGEITTCPQCHGSIVRGNGDIRNRNYSYPRIV